eukprot:12754693-Alexandrium_andersonii.AAC.1
MPEATVRFPQGRLRIEAGSSTDGPRAECRWHFEHLCNVKIPVCALAACSPLLLPGQSAHPSTKYSPNSNKESLPGSRATWTSDFP